MERAVRTLAASSTRSAERGSITVGSAVPVAPHAALLRYVVTPSRIRILVTTTAGRRAFTSRLGSQRLNRLVFALRQAVQDPNRDPLPSARALYDVLIRPVETHLSRQKVDRLLLSPDGALRMVPFAALHDGSQYLVQRHALLILTVAPRSEDGPPAATSERLAAFGVSREVAGLPALPRVASELKRIVKGDANDRDGILPGVVVLDAEFTAERLSRVLGEGYPLVHVASHFVFRPGPLDQSFLVLGDGGRLTLERLKAGEFSLRGIQLLALSACSTALGEGGSGRELESFGILAHRLGAREVVATLWQVADLSTAALMNRFYTERTCTGRDDAMALARAQRSFLDRSGPASWAHPFHWAPFLLLASP